MATGESEGARMALVPQDDDTDIETALQLARFAYRNGGRLAACAAIHPRVAQLASTHPLAFFTLATAGGPLDARELAILRTVEGKPLSVVSAALGLPLCMRRLPPEVFKTRLLHVRWSPGASRRLSPLIPRDTRTARAWLGGITLAARIGDETIAIWLARHHKLFAEGRTLPRSVIPLIVFAWHANRPDLLYGVQPWTPDMDGATTVMRAAAWVKRVKLHAIMAETGLEDVWLPEGELRGVRFVPLTTPRALIEEASAMNNCLVEYGEGLARNICRLYSIRRGGVRLATLEVRPSGRSGRLVGVQMRGAGNADCPLDLWHLATQWVDSHTQAGARMTTGAHPPLCVDDQLRAFLVPYLSQLTDRDKSFVALATFTSMQDQLAELGRLVGAKTVFLRWA